jgi:apolipoprotein D and lipocalin family protein
MSRLDGTRYTLPPRPLEIDPMTLRIPKGGRATSRLLILGALGTVGITLAACSTIVSRHPIGNATVPEPNKAVDLRQYLGRWYEIARYEQSFQRGCKGVTADYALRADGSIDVLNRCRKGQGKISAARGRAKVVDAQTGAKLKVSFFGPFYGDYWVLDHADDYSWSIVGEPSGRYLWILHREATPPEAQVRQLIERARGLGYDTAMLLRTEQP